jgi:hypothetical protein
MSQRKSIIFFTLVVAIVAFFAATNVMAADPATCAECSYECNVFIPAGELSNKSPECTLTVTAIGRDGNPVSAGDVFPFPSTNDDPSFPCPEPYNVCSVARYLLTDNCEGDALNKINHAYGCFPRCCGDDSLDIYGIGSHIPLSDNEYSLPGDPDSPWPNTYNCYSVIMSPDPSSNNEEITMYTSVAEGEVMDIAFRFGNVNSPRFYCDAGVIGPFCASWNQSAVMTESVVETPDGAGFKMKCDMTDENCVPYMCKQPGEQWRACNTKKIDEVLFVDYDGDGMPDEDKPVLGKSTPGRGNGYSVFKVNAWYCCNKGICSF